MDKDIAGAVYVQTNQPQNSVVAFRRAPDGTLARGATYVTGGAGSGVPHLTSQGSVVLTVDRQNLLVTNAASDEVSTFAVAPDGSLMLVGHTPVGATPKSIAERDGLVYVLNTGTPSLTGYRLSGQGLAPITGAEYPLSAANADPAQVGFDPAGQYHHRHRAGHECDRRVPSGEGRSAGSTDGDRVVGPDPVRIHDHGRRRPGRDRGLRRAEGEGGSFLICVRRFRCTASYGIDRERSQRDLLGSRNKRRPLRLHHELRRRRDLALRGRRDGTLTLEDATAGIPLMGDRGCGMRP